MDLYENPFGVNETALTRSDVHETFVITYAHNRKDKLDLEPWIVNFY